MQEIKHVEKFCQLTQPACQYITNLKTILIFKDSNVKPVCQLATFYETLNFWWQIRRTFFVQRGVHMPKI
jgi:hypothetical protein